jgi:hypothetical protein
MKTSIQAAAAAITLLAFQAAHAQDAVQWRVQDGGNGHWYQMRSPGPITWPSAKIDAERLGGYLATPTTEAEKSLVTSLILAVPGFGESAIYRWGPWLGGFQDRSAPTYTEPLGAWRWITGEQWGYSAWRMDEPNNLCSQTQEQEDFLAISGNGVQSNGAWNDLPPNGCGNDPVVSYIIEWSADCNNDGVVDYGQCRDGTLPDYDGDNIPDCCERGEACVVGNYPVRWRVEDGGNGHWYQLSVLPPRRFWELVSDAEAVGGHLVTVGSAEENAFARSISLGYFVHFGAFHDAALPGYSEPSNGWRWVNGEPWNWTGWCVGQPDNAPWGGFQGQELARFGGAASACWDDAHSLAQIATIFIEATMFEWSADCNNDGIVDYGQILQGQLADTNADGVPDICQGPTCADADLFRDFNVNGADLGILLSQWGPNTPLTESDLNGDGVVNGADLGLLLSFWGACP